MIVFAVVFLGIMAYLLKIGFGTTGSPFGPGATTQGDTRGGGPSSASTR